MVPDGAGLLCGVLHHLLSRGIACPKVLVTTHFHEIFNNGLLNMSLPISFVHMEVIISSSADDSVSGRRLSSAVNGIKGEDMEEEEEEGTRRALEQFTFLYRYAIHFCRSAKQY